MADVPDLSEPFTNDSERAACLADLLHLTAELNQWRGWALDPDGLSPRHRAALAASTTPGDSPEVKLTRWADLFDDELRAVSDARNRAVHGIRIGDRELRGAVWLARRLLALVESADAA